MAREKLQRGLGLFLDAMRPYAVSIISRETILEQSDSHIVIE